MVKLEKALDEIYEELIIGFILELKRQNVGGREIGKQLAKLNQVLSVWDK